MADDKKNENFEEDQNGDEDLELPDGAALAKEIQDDINRQVQMHFSRLENDVRDVFSQRMASIESNLNSQISERVLTAQSDILKMNKVFREICRPLGAKWKELFLRLTEGLERSKVNEEVASIEKQSSIMQPYKSLMSWKELKGKSFNMDDLIPALRGLELDELAQKVESVLHKDSTDELFDLSGFGKSLTSEPGTTPTRASRSSVPMSRTRTTSCGSTGASPGVSSATTTHARSSDDCPMGAAAVSPSPCSSKDRTLEASGFTSPVLPPVATSNNEGIIDDRHILLLAKQVAEVWDKLAKALRVPQNDISDILTSEGSLNYQGAFRMLWIWRESRVNRPEGSIEVLASALERIGKGNLVDLLRS